jgi:phosphopantetheine adenylyltransferase
MLKLLLRGMYYVGKSAVLGSFEKLENYEKHLLEEAFKRAEFVFVGIVADDEDKRLKAKIRKLSKLLAARYPGRYEVVEVRGEFAPAVEDEEVHTLVVPSQELAQSINEAREKRGLKRLVVVEVPPPEVGETGS